MAYTPTDWQTGDVVTAEKLNKLENGVAGGGSGNLIATLTYNSADAYYTLDKSWRDIKNALDAGGIVIAKDVYEESPGVISTDIWYLFIIISTESSTEDLPYGAGFRHLWTNERITFSATDPDAPLTTLEESDPQT